MEKNSDLPEKLNKDDSLLNLSEIPPELLELILLEIHEQPPNKSSDDKIISKDFCNISLQCRFFQKVTLATDYKIWKQRYLNLMLEEYNPNLIKLSTLPKIIIENIDNLKNNPYLLKYIYFSKIHSVDLVIFKLIELIKNDKNYTNDWSLYEAVIEGNLFSNIKLEVIINRLFALNYHINYNGKQSRNILHYFALTGDINAVTLLIDAGANVNQLDNIGMTPLGKVVQGIYILSVKIFKPKIDAQLAELIELRDKYLEMAKYLVKYTNIDSTRRYAAGQQQTQDSEFSTTLVDLFKTFEYLSDYQVNQNEFDLLYNLAAVVLSYSRFRNNFEQFLDVNHINLDNAVINRIRDTVDNYNLTIEPIHTDPIKTNKKYKIEGFINYLQDNIRSKIALSLKCLRKLLEISNELKESDKSQSSNFIKKQG